LQGTSTSARSHFRALSPQQQQQQQSEYLILHAPGLFGAETHQLPARERENEEEALCTASDFSTVELHFCREPPCYPCLQNATLRSVKLNSGYKKKHEFFLVARALHRFFSTG